MARIIVLLALLLGAVGLAAGEARAQAVHVVPVEGPIGPATSDLVTRSIERAAAEGAALVVLRLDTPGGLDTSMRAIVQAIIDAPLPVVAYVAPSGARAASAGTYILYASHIAAMAPGTNLGAATPVAIGGGGDRGAERSTGETKAVEDAAAYLRSLAELRGRDAAFAERAVRDARSMTHREALAAGVIDLVAQDLAALLAAIDGRAVELARGTVVIASAGAATHAVEPDWRYRLLAIITDPTVAAILLMIGVYGIIIEFYTPGLTGPGLIGVICLLLGLYALQVLPVNLTGVALLVLGTILVVAEAFVPSFGVLGITGIVAFSAGAILLVESDLPGFGVSPYVIGALAAVLSGLFVLTSTLVLRGRDRPVVTGAEAIEHGEGEVVAWQDGEGRVRLEGELWHARGPVALEPGARVAVKSRDGLTLTVEPASTTS